MKDRIKTANHILETLGYGIELYQGNRELRMRWPKWNKAGCHDFPARLRGDGSWPAFGYRQRPCGGTGIQALAQVIRYVRNLPRLPVITWQYWTSDKVKIGNAQTLEIIKSSDYGDPTKTCCILCGCTDFKNGLDWWSLDGKTGPCCMFEACEEKKP